MDSWIESVQNLNFRLGIKLKHSFDKYSKIHIPFFSYIPSKLSAKKQLNNLNLSVFSSENSLGADLETGHPVGMYLLPMYVCRTLCKNKFYKEVLSCPGLTSFAGTLFTFSIETTLFFHTYIKGA